LAVEPAKHETNNPHNLEQVLAQENMDCNLSGIANALPDEVPADAYAQQEKNVTHVSAPVEK
jgi:hypothetical protein